MVEIRNGWDGDRVFGDDGEGRWWEGRWWEGAMVVREGSEGVAS